jgi:hypothetical protein
MRSIMKALLIGGAALTVAATGASAAVVCNDEGDCWHVKGHAKYKPGLKLHVYGDDWKWKDHDHDKYRWREHKGHGYWRSGVWIDLG